LAFRIVVMSAVLNAADCFAQMQPVKHTISVTFDYDFTQIHACSATIKKKCIAQFIVYDISGKKPYKLFSIPTPPGAAGALKGIQGDSQPLLFEAGRHQIAVSAQMESGEESNPRAAAVWIEIP
jgi:hypothetical protein